MSFLLKQAINELVTNTTDLQTLLLEKADTSLTYTKTQVNDKFSGLIDSAPAALDTLKELSLALNSDSNFGGKVVSSLAEKAPILSPIFTGTATFESVSGITKDMVGLGNVNNTADKDKIVSDPTQTALNLLAPKAGPAFTGTVTGITSTMVGLGNVNNTSDKLKIVSDPTQAALDTLTTGLTGKEPVFTVLSPFIKSIQLTGPNAGKIQLSVDTAAPYSVGSLTAFGNVGCASLSSSGDVSFLNATQTNLVGKKMLKIGQTGDVTGDSNLYITNRSGGYGLTVENTSSDAAQTLVEQVYKTYLTSRSVRLENRLSFARCNAPSFHIGGVAAEYPTLAVGDSYCAIANKLTIGSYNARTDPLYVEGNATISGDLQILGTIYGVHSSDGGILNTGVTALSIVNANNYEVAKFWNLDTKLVQCFGLFEVDGNSRFNTDVTVIGRSYLNGGCSVTGGDLYISGGDLNVASGGTNLHTSATNDVAIIDSTGADTMRVADDGSITLAKANMTLTYGGGRRGRTRTIQ